MNHPVLDHLLRDLGKLAEELNKYADEELIWKTREGISNSAGTLCLHLCGNLRHFIGSVLGNDGYVRKRDEEFSLRNIPREKLLAEIEVTKEAITKAFPSITPEKLQENYPLNILGAVHTTEYFLIFLVGHFNYHLGQVNYHRRLIR